MRTLLVTALLTCGMLLGGCATTEHVAIPCPDPLPPPPAPPQALVHISDRSTLPDDFTEIPLEQALRILLRSHLFDVETLTELEAKHAALVDYIESVVQSVQ